MKPKKKIKEPSFFEELTRTPYPKVKAQWVNCEGYLALNTIDVFIESPKDWSNIPFLITKLFPSLLLPIPMEENEDEEKDKKKSYTG